jgi:Uma2 family endonuclease
MLQLRDPLDAVGYLEREADVPERYEYVNGHAYALSGSSREHARLVTNLVGHAFNALPRRPSCAVFSQAMKVHIAERNSFYYPDVVATCEWPTRDDRYIVRAPCFIAEVLSPSTASIDRREKRVAYMTLPSLEQYVVVDQDRMRVDMYCRDGQRWNLAILREPEQQLRLACLDCSLTLEQLYAGVELPLQVAEEEPELEWLTA